MVSSGSTPNYGAVVSSSDNADTDDDNVRVNQNNFTFWRWRWPLIAAMIMMLPFLRMDRLDAKVLSGMLATSNLSATFLRLENHPTTSSCLCPTDGKPSREGQYCKSLLLLRHAKSSWKNSFFIDDIDRHLSNKGIGVAHKVGQQLHHSNVKLPELVFSSSSVRTMETLNIVLGEWFFGAESHMHENAKVYFKSKSKNQHKMLNKALEENMVKIQYSDELYTLSDGGYLQYLVAALKHYEQVNSGNEPSSVMVVGHNPAIEDLLNDLSPRRLSSTGATLDTWRRDFTAGRLYEICFPRLKSWEELKQTDSEQRLGVVSLVLPHK